MNNDNNNKNFRNKNNDNNNINNSNNNSAINSNFKKETSNLEKPRSGTTIQYKKNPETGDLEKATSRSTKQFEKNPKTGKSKKRKYPSNIRFEKNPKTGQLEKPKSASNISSKINRESNNKEQTKHSSETAFEDEPEPHESRSDKIKGGPTIPEMDKLASLSPSVKLENLVEKEPTDKMKDVVGHIEQEFPPLTWGQEVYLPSQKLRRASWGLVELNKPETYKVSPEFREKDPILEDILSSQNVNKEDIFSSQNINKKDTFKNEIKTFFTLYERERKKKEKKRVIRLEKRNKARHSSLALQPLSALVEFEPRLDKAKLDTDQSDNDGSQWAIIKSGLEQECKIKPYALPQVEQISADNFGNGDYANLAAEYSIVRPREGKQVWTEHITPFLFLIKNKLTQIKEKTLKINNYTNIQKHFIPSYMEWCHSIYAYNRETIKKLPALDKAASKLIKGYFNLYDISKEKNARSKRARVKSRRYSHKRVITSKLNFKHTNNKVIIMTHVFNRRIKYLFNSINAIPTIDKMLGKNYYSFIKVIKPKILILKSYMDMHREIAFIKDLSNNPDKYVEILNKSINLKKICKNNKLIYKVFSSNVHLKKILNNNTKLKAIIFHTNLLDKILKAYAPLIDFFNRKKLSTPLHWHQYLMKTVKRFFYKEMQSFSLRQINFIEKSKFNKLLLLPLINLLEIVFRKKIEFTFINAKYIYNSASILGESVVNKLKNRKLKPLNVLNQLFNMIKLPTKRNFVLFGKVYYNKYSLQNMTLKDLKINTSLLPLDHIEQAITMDSKSNLYNKSDTYVNDTLNLDPLEQLICFADSNIDTMYLYEKSSYNINKTLTGLKYKFLTGARVEAAGRLTKRNTAERAVNKSKYIGNLKNTDSSFKGLPATMIKGFEKCSVQYNFLSSKLKTGSYGVKTWVNAN